MLLVHNIIYNNILLYIYKKYWNFYENFFNFIFSTYFSKLCIDIKKRKNIKNIGVILFYVIYFIYFSTKIKFKINILLYK